MSKPFETLILACLAKEPADRPDAAGLQERLLRLSAAASGAGSAAPGAGGVAGSLAGAAQEIGAVARGLRDRVNPAGASDATTQALLRPFRRRRNRRAALVVAGAAGAVALLVLALVGAAVVGAPFRGSDAGGETTQQVADSGVQSVAETPVGTTEETTSAPVDYKPPPPPSKAEEAVYDMYVKESYQDPNKVWPYLSRRLQDEVGSPERWAEREQLGTLRDVYFTQMPNARLSGETAEVSFQVREDRTGGSKLVGGAWECVNEGGEWKLDRLVGGNS